jgi:hypothetical protein
LLAAWILIAPGLLLARFPIALPLLAAWIPIAPSLLLARFPIALPLLAVWIPIALPLLAAWIPIALPLLPAWFPVAFQLLLTSTLVTFQLFVVILAVCRTLPGKEESKKYRRSYWDLFCRKFVSHNASKTRITLVTLLLLQILFANTVPVPVFSDKTNKVRLQSLIWCVRRTISFICLVTWHSLDVRVHCDLEIGLTQDFMNDFGVFCVGIQDRPKRMTKGLPTNALLQANFFLNPYAMQLSGFKQWLPWVCGCPTKLSDHSYA